MQMALSVCSSDKVIHVPEAKTLQAATQAVDSLATC